VSKYLFMFVDGAERRRAFAASVATLVAAAALALIVGFPLWPLVFAAVALLGSILLRPLVEHLELAKRAEQAELGRGPDSPP
jgi:uncharacterized RDD family membrane protein YckC